MNSKKWSFSKAVAAYFLVTFHALASASTTKVGNGDDGRDLEGGTPIISGIILETRDEAIEVLKKLNIQGVAGLGTLIPELEHSQMLMAAIDTRPIAMEGDWERSQDGQRVYARTFAEPHAPTRFFPAAEKLTREQLIALHTHEALHRALPANVREDEDKVSLLTMALTSPSATFDRVNRIASETLTERPRTPRSWVESNSLTASLSPKSLPAAQKNKLRFNHSTYLPKDESGFLFSAQNIGIQKSPFGVFTIGNQPVEAILSVDAFLVEAWDEKKLGPLSFTAKAALRHETNSTFGPYAQFNLRSLETMYSRAYKDRDVYSVGGFLENESELQSSTLLVTYTAKSDSQLAEGRSQPIGSIWSAFAREGLKWRRLTLGGIFEFHHCLGTANVSDPFSILRAGPEVKWSNGRLSVGISGVLTVNREFATLDDLGDLAGHGAGHSTLSAFLSGNI